MTPTSSNMEVYWHVSGKRPNDMNRQTVDFSTLELPQQLQATPCTVVNLVGDIVLADPQHMSQVVSWLDELRGVLPASSPMAGVLTQQLGFAPGDLTRLRIMVSLFDHTSLSRLTAALQQKAAAYYTVAFGLVPGSSSSR